ncbi:MAG TPA: serine/threonine-protein kinase [Polyangiaceae bacterium]|nr:serine/threonine-protein kinase [Polyangiaceae bacterium]
MKEPDLGTAKTAPEISPERWRRIEELFLRAVELPEAEQGALVAREAGDDPVVRAEVAALIAGDRKERENDASERLREKIASEAEQVVGARARAQVGRRLGPYRLIELLGEGGMGAVYLAERVDEEYRGRVAIKILQHGSGSPQAIARFRDERQILATLEHPGIVRLLDGGHTDDGLPYLVLERVDGVPITEYAREKGLKARALVELVLSACAALQYAHGKLVVHRDIKPSNLLVDRSGAPKLLDFGIAKLLDPHAEFAREASTRTGMPLLTPQYASPEQARGEPVSVATDVYSLGGVLYELVTGRPPQQPGGGHLETLRAICETQPPRASAVAPLELRREVKGDLDKIIEKALRKDARERYASVEQFADDLRRYLEGRPVKAHAATFAYRADKFVRRNQGKLALAVLFVAGLSAAALVSVSQARRAEAQARRADAEAARARERYGEVRKLANSLLFEIDEAIRDVAGTTRARELVVTRALTYLDWLAGQPDRDPALSRELALGYMKIGDIQGNPFDPNIGKPLEGLRSYEKAAGLLDGLDPADPAVISARIRVLFGTGFMYHISRDVERARARLTEALGRALEAPPGVEVDRVLVARAYLALAFHAKEINNVVEADRYTDEGLAFVDRWGAETDEARYWRASFLGRRADSAARAGDPEGAVAALRAVTALYADLADKNPTIPKYRREQVYALLLLGIATGGVGDSRLWVANVGDLDGAEAAFRQGLAILERIAADDPSDADAKVSVGIFRSSLGLVAAKRSPRGALAELERALKAYEAIPRETRATPYVRENEFILHCAMARSLAAAGQPDARARAAVGLDLAAGGPFNVAMCESLVGRMARELGDPAAAVARFESVRRALTPMADQPDTSALIGLVDTLQQLAALRPAEACAYHAEALARWNARPATTPYLRRRAGELAAAVERCAAKR